MEKVKIDDDAGILKIVMIQAMMMIVKMIVETVMTIEDDDYSDCENGRKKKR